MKDRRVAVLAGGVGAAKLLAGMVRAVPPQEVAAIVNVGDDLELHGLHISPDVDTVIYTVAGAVDQVRGWGLQGETWHAMEALERYGGATWFRLGDRDLATHLYRSQRLVEGARLSTVIDEIARAWGLQMQVLPVTDDRLRTKVTLLEEGSAPFEVSFQDYFVKRKHDCPVAAVRFEGATESRAAPGVPEALAGAAKVVIAPSNPIVSIGPVVAVPEVREAMTARRADVVAVSPIVGGRALKGPADRMLRELGHEASVVGVARLYAPLAATLVIDTSDAEHADRVEAEGLRCVTTGTVMTDADAAAGLCRTLLDL